MHGTTRRSTSEGRTTHLCVGSGEIPFTFYSRHPLQPLGFKLLEFMGESSRFTCTKLGASAGDITITQLKERLNFNNQDMIKMAYFCEVYRVQPVCRDCSFSVF